MSQGPAQLPLTLNIVQLLEPGTKVEAPQNIVYSRSPKVATALDGCDYFIKGPEVEVILAEAVSYLLARLLGIPVPEFGITVVDEFPYFASRKVPQRNVSRAIERGLVANPKMLSETIVFDIWAANIDRNIGNFVGEMAGDNSGKVKLYAIDFEKAACLAERTPLVKVPDINPRKFWPKDALGDLLKGKPLPSEFCDRIASVSENSIRRSLELVLPHVVDIPWAESCIQVLRSRAQVIHRLAKEVWR